MADPRLHHRRLAKGGETAGQGIAADRIGDEASAEHHERHPKRNQMQPRKHHPPHVFRNAVAHDVQQAADLALAPQSPRRVPVQPIHHQRGKCDGHRSPGEQRVSGHGKRRREKQTPHAPGGNQIGNVALKRGCGCPCECCHVEPPREQMRTISISQRGNCKPRAKAVSPKTGDFQRFYATNPRAAASPILHLQPHSCMHRTKKTPSEIACAISDGALF